MSSFAAGASSALREARSGADVTMTVRENPWPALDWSVVVKLIVIKLVAAIVLGPFAAPLAAEAQHVGKVHRIGVLANVSGGAWRAFIQGLRDLGYVEGQNIAIEFRSSEGQYERLTDLAAELVRLEVDVIVAPAKENVVVAKQATRTIPIVMVGSFAKSIAPRTSRVAVLSNPTNRAVRSSLGEVEVAARSLGLQLQLLEARRPEEFQGAFAAMARERAGALLVFPDGMFLLHRTRIANLAAKSRLPAMYGVRDLGLTIPPSVLLQADQVIE